MRVFRALGLAVLLVTVAVSFFAAYAFHRVDGLLSNFRETPFDNVIGSDWPSASENQRPIVTGPDSSGVLSCNVFVGSKFYLMEFSLVSDRKAVFSETLYSSDENLRPFLKIDDSRPPQILVYQPFFVRQAPGIKRLGAGYWVFRYDGNRYRGKQELPLAVALLQNPFPLNWF